MYGQTKMASLALPLALLLALAQGGSCGGASGAGTNRNVQINTNVKVNARVNSGAGANANGGAGARANVNANTDIGGEGAEAESAAGADKAAGVAGGSWGGRGVQLDVGADGARIELDCAHGRMGKLKAGAGGTFEAAGVFVAERGGPVHIDERENEQPARFHGKVVGKTMTLNISVEGHEGSGERLTFTLTRGREGRLTKCL